MRSYRISIKWLKSKFSKALSERFSIASITSKNGAQYFSMIFFSVSIASFRYDDRTSKKKFNALVYNAGFPSLHDCLTAQTAICVFPAPRLPIITAIIPLPRAWESLHHCAPHSAEVLSFA